MPYQRRTARRPQRRRFVKRNPMRTREVREPRWNYSNFRFVTEFANANPLENIISIAIMNPSFMLEGRGDLWSTDGGLLDAEGVGTAYNQLNSIRGVKVGGIVWTSHWTTQQVPDYEFTTIAHAICEEFLVTERVDDDGIPVAQTRWQETWRPITVSDNPTEPQDGDGGLVRCHRRRMTLMPIGSNAIEVSDDIAAAHNSINSSVAHPNWGGTQTMRLRHWIPEEHQLAFHLAVNWTLDPQTPIAITHVLTGGIYWKLVR